MAKVALAVFAGLAAVFLLLWAFFPWDALREPINRYASERLGRHFEITRKLEVHPGWTTRVSLHGVVLSNPEWAARPNLIEAERADFSIRLWPLLRGRLEMPDLTLQRPRVALQLEPDGRRSWSLSRDTSDQGAVPVIGTLRVDQGELHYLAAAQGADVASAFSIDPAAGQELPLRFQARGKWRGEPFQAVGRGGAVLQLQMSSAQPYPLQIDANAGRTSLKATGTVADLGALDGVDARIDLRGATLADLYHLLGVVLPETPAYALQGQLSHRGGVWSVARIQGRLGKSDLSGDLTYDRTRPVALLAGQVRSAVLDFNDLAPLVGAKGSGKSAVQDARPASRAAAPASAPVATAASRPREGNIAPPAHGPRLLPAAVLDLQRLQAMNADVRYEATKVRHVQALPLDSMRAHIRLDAGVLRLEPLDLGVAGGRVAGLLHIDGRADPARVTARLGARQLQLNQLFPTVKLTQGSLGRLNGRIELQGRGNSTARMLGTADGHVALLMGRGTISNMLLEVLGLDGGEIAKFLLGGDRNVELRCAAAAFDVRQGLMSSRSLVLDTADTVVLGQGEVSLADETLNLVLRPEPKDGSILSLRSPLRIGGTFADPSAGPDKAALAGRVGLALALGAVNPLLALAATVETGPGKDADCQRVLALAAVPGPGKPAPAARP